MSEPTRSGRPRGGLLESDRWQIPGAVLLLTATVAIVFWPVVSFAFIDLDEDAQVVENPFIRGLTGANLVHILTARCMTSYYPVRTLTFALDYQLWGLDAGAFKRTNAVIHGANVLLVFWLTLRLLRVMAPGEGRHSAWDVAVSAIGAAAFAIHPLVVEPVAWVLGREELLMTTGALGCVHIWLSARRLEGRERIPAAASCYAASAACCAASCLSNAAGAVVPILAATLDIALLPKCPWWKTVLRVLPLLAIGSVTIVLKKLTPAAGTAYLPDVLSLEWLLLIGTIYGLNVRAVVWPTQLAVFYNWPLAESYTAPEIVFGAIAVGLTLLLLWSVRRQRMVVFGLLWFLVALSPAAQVMPHHIPRADRFLYLPLAGLVLSMAAAMSPRWDYPRRRLMVAATATTSLIVLLFLAGLARRQLLTWKDGLSVWSHCLAVEPDNPMAHTGLADSLSRSGRFEEAIPHYHMALRLDPDRREALNNFALRLAADDREDLRDYDLAVQLATRGCERTGWSDCQLRHTLSMAHANRALSEKRNGEYGRALDDYRKAIDADPGYDAPLFNLALLLAACPDDTLRRPDEAVVLAERASRAAKSLDATRLSILAQAYAAAGGWDQAADAFQRAIQTAEREGNPQFAEQLRLQQRACMESTTPRE